MGVLYVVATPVGNLEDITIRAVRVLLNTGVIVCEDTRHTGQLIKILRERFKMYESLDLHQGIRKKFISVRDWNEVEVIPRVLEELGGGDTALVSDAGTPLLSDPGFKVVRAAREAGFRVVPIPGPFAGAAALSVAGLPTNKFMFWGFLPKKWQLEAEVTHVIYESPVRATKTIEEINIRYPNARIVVAKELTKLHESIEPWREGMAFKGEVTLLVFIPKSVDTQGGQEIAAGHGDGNGDA